MLNQRDSAVTADPLAAAVAALEAVRRGDREAAHANADAILLDYMRATGSGAVADAWDRLRQGCGGFWYA